MESRMERTTGKKERGAMVQKGQVPIGIHCGTAGTGARNGNFPGHAGRAQLVMLATDRGTPGVAKRATFYFPDWDEGSETFDTLAMIAEIVQDACVDGKAVRQHGKAKRSPDCERAVRDGRTMAVGEEE